MNNAQYAQNMLRLQDTIASLRADNARLEQRGPSTRAMRGDLEDARMFAGLTAVEGPGIVVTLNDSAKRLPAGIPDALRADISNNFLIHDVDIQRVVNELHAAGAEAEAVNGQRIVSTTAIRCVGPAIQVNAVPLTPPFKIAAIGKAQTLAEALNMPGGITDQLKDTDPAMISIALKDKTVLPAYDGATAFKYARPISDSSAAASSGSVMTSHLAGDMQTTSFDAGYWSAGQGQ
jgi:uncharacterized protein YlxW (UPF0749 family)